MIKGGEDNLKVNTYFFSLKFILVWLMLCICMCHSKSIIPGIVIGTIQLFYVIVCFLNKNNKTENITISHINTLPLMWNSFFVFSCVISIIWANNMKLVYQIIPQLYMRFCLVLFISYFFKNKKDITYGILVYLFSCGYMILKMLAYMVLHPANYFNNVIFYKVCEDALGVNFNQVAQILAIGIIFSLIWISKKKICIPYIAISLLFIFMTGSRKGFLMPLVGIIIFYCLRDIHYLKKQLKNIVIFLFMTLVVIFFLAKNPIYVERLKIMFQAVFSGKTADLSTTERMFFISLASKMFLARPFFGWGANNFRGVLASTGYSNVVYCHNNYLEIASGLGVVGLVTNYWFYIYTLFKSVTKVKRVPTVALTIAIFSVFLIFEYGIVTYLFPTYIYILTIAYYYAVYE